MKNSLLDFCCWSTTQLNSFAQHLLARTTTFLYAESGLDFVFKGGTSLLSPEPPLTSVAPPYIILPAGDLA